MADFADKNSISRRSILRMAGGATFLAAMPFVSKVLAAGAVEAAIEWARTNLPNSTPDIVNAAAKEAKLSLTLYNLGGGDEAIRGIVEGFNRRYPFIAVDYTRQDTLQLLNKFNAEINTKRGISDYLNLPSNLLTSKALMDQGAIAKFVVSQDGSFPKNGKSSGFWYAWRSEKPTTLYRTDALNIEEKKLIRTYQGLADPRFKGRLGATSANNSVCVAAAYTLMYGSDPRLWTGLAKNGLLVKPSSQALVSSVLAGEVDIGVLCGSSSPAVAARSGAPLAFGYSSPSPTLYTPGAVSALAPHPNAAKLWQDWFTSVEGQDIWVRLSGLPPVRDKVHETGWAEKQPWFFADNRDLGEFDWDAFSKKQGEVLERFKKDVQNG